MQGDMDEEGFPVLQRVEEPNENPLPGLRRLRRRRIFEDRESESLSDMDEEGFPRLQQVADQSDNPFPALRRLRRRRSEDQESGELTHQQVRVIRRSPEGHSAPQRDQLRYHDDLFRRAVALRVNFMALTFSLPGFECHHPASHMETRKGKKRNLRIPLDDPSQSQPKTQQKKEIIVSIWKECVYGERLFDASEKEMREAPKSYLECFTINMPKDIPNYIPVICVRIFFILVIILKCILNQINIPFCIFYRNHQHEQIHRKCEERGLKPIFTGPAVHGPIIWAVRNITCQYCRAQKQYDISLKLLKILNQERRNGQAKLLNQERNKMQDHLLNQKRSEPDNFNSKRIGLKTS